LPLKEIAIGHANIVFLLYVCELLRLANDDGNRNVQYMKSQPLGSICFNKKALIFVAVEQIDL
jgi:hypothetical protein